MPVPNYQLRVRYCDPFGSENYQLLLCISDNNSQFILLWSDVSYAACKTAAGNIFKATFTWDDTNMQTNIFSNFTTGA